MQVFSLSEATQRNLSELVNCRCASREELMAVLWRTETVFTKQNVMTVLAYLLNYDLLPELALSGLGNSVPFWKWLADIFPLSQTEYHTSVFPRLMTRISKFVTSQAFESHDGDIQEYLNRQESAGEALQILAELDLRTRARPLNSRKASAKALKKAKNHAEQQETPTALAQFSVSLPTTLEARDQAVASILVQLKQALKLYLKILSTPSAQYTVQVLFLSRSEQRSSQIPSNAVNSTEVMRGNGGFTPMGRLEGFGEWKILVSRRAERNLRDAHRKVPNMFNIIMKKIKELSQGYFTDDNQKRLNGPDTEVPIFEAKMSKDTRLVYQIHCEYDRETKVDEQVIRVFGIFSHAKLGKRLWDSIGCQLGQKGAEYRRRFVTVIVHDDMDQDDEILCRCLYRQPRNTGYGDTVFVPASFPMLPENNDVQPLTIPSLPSEDLEKVHDILVLQQYMVMSEGLLRSILMDIDVTFPFHLSPQESRIVEHKMSSYILGRSGTGKTTCMLYKMIWNEQVYQMHRDTLSRPRQMFVTKSTKLASKVQEDYNKLISSFQFSHSLAEHLALNEQTSALVGPSPASAQLPLPAKFSELEDGHFPLFIPYDKLLRLIEEDYNISPEAHWGQVIKEPVSYKKFRRQYWHHLPQHLTRGMDPTMVFNEIIGVIKGSERTLPPNDRFLDRVTYRDTRTNPTFYGRQEELYSLFEAYQTKKIEFQDYDPADRTHNLLRALRKDDIKGGRLDYLFVDEAQDNLLIDALVLRSLCHNPYGLFWAGDTAQTILAGSSFRFEDLKAFLHRVEQQQSENITPSQHYRIESMSKPSTFQLTVNYRSHKGITDCAHAVIELLTTFWPDSIDILAPERGVVDGVKPVFLTRWGSEANANILTESLNGTSMELGSNQCILVRNEEARDSLRGQLKNATIVSTIYDSKGLEFDDVLLLNFFEDSPCDAAHWRLVLNKVKASGGQHHRAPTFDDIQHVGLCTELKFLYVAITRARKTLWIADRSAKAGPMKDYWLSRDQIIVSTSSTALEKLAVFSSPEDWAIRGEDFFQHEDFATAQQCFERAGQPHRASEANAWLLKRLANEIPTSSRYRRRLGFIEAAQAFLGCVENDHTRRLFLLNEAAQCYALASELTTAADIFLKAQDHDSAATCYLQLEAFGILCTFVPRHRGKISEATISDIRMKACPHYYRQEDFENASRFFASKPQEIEYLKSQGKGWILFLAQVYARIGEAERAARIYIQEDLVMQAIPLLLKCQPGCTQEASRYIVNELWKHVSFSRRADLHPSFGALQAMWDVVDKGHCGPELEEEFRLLQAVSTLDRSKLGPIGRAYLHRKRVPAALLCISHFFEDFPTKTDNAGHVAKILFLFKDYIAALVNVTFPGPEGIDVDEHPMSFYPFGVRNGPSNDLLCLANTFMCPDQIHEGDMLVGKFTRQGFELPRSALKARFRRYLDAYIAEKYQQACEYFEQYIHTHQPCISLSVSAVCHQHVKASDVHCRLFSSSDWLNRIDIILSHSMTMQSVHKRLETRIHDGKSTCMNLLYQALTALSFHRNDIARLEDLSVIDEGRSLVRNWTNHSAFSLDYENPDICLAWFLRASRMRILHCDQQPAVNFMQQIRLNISLRQPYFYSPFRDGPSLGYLIADLERLELDHATDQIERALVVLRIVLQGPYQLDLQVLCRWFEILTGLILLKPLWNDTINLHGRRRVTLPLSVAIQGINVVPHTSDMNRPKQVYAIFDLIEKTMDILFSEEMKERFAFQYDAFTVIPQADISVARICRMYCLIGYNHRDLRSKLLVTFKRLKALTVVRPGPSLSGRYSSVTNEQEILSALVSTPSSLGDRLVRLCETGQSTETVGEVQGIKTISYQFDEADQLFERLVDLIKPRGSPEVQNEEVSTNCQVAQGGSTPSGDGPACAMESSQSMVSPQSQEANHDLSSA